MSDKYAGHIEQNSEASNGKQFSQPWTPGTMQLQPMQAKYDNTVPQEFGNVQIVDNSTQPLRGKAAVEAHGQPKYVPEYHSAYDQPNHAEKLHSQVQHTEQHKFEPKIGGQVIIPPSISTTYDSYGRIHQQQIPSETVSTTMKASDYQEGMFFKQPLMVKANDGLPHHYNALTNAYFVTQQLSDHRLHRTLVGVPTHVGRNGVQTDHFESQVTIPLDQK